MLAILNDALLYDIKTSYAQNLRNRSFSKYGMHNGVKFSNSSTNFEILKKEYRKN